jgi:hypothetical protein
MKAWHEVGASAVVTGTVASLVSSAALAMLARLEGKSAIQPLNATSHWLHGEDAGKVGEPDLRHTALGYATHHCASISGRACSRSRFKASGERLRIS